MSKLTELLDKLCPDGVEFVELGSICDVRSGWGFPRSEQGVKSEVIPFFKVGDMNRRGNEIVMNVAGNYIAEATSEKLGVRPAPAGTIIFPKIGAAIATNKKRILREKSAYDNNVMGLVPRDAIDPAFLFHWIQSVNLTSWGNDSGAVPSIRKPTVEKVLIPLPPLEVQQEIVRVLDAFTDLEQSLVSERELRKKQFDSVRRSVISDSQAAEKKVLRLREAESEGIVTLGRGKVISKKDIAANPGDYPVYSSSGAGNGEFGRYGNYMFDDERISWSVDGGGRLFYRPAHRYSVTNVSGWMTVNISDLQVKYLYYVLLSQWENESFDYTRKAHPSVIREVYAFSIPTIEIQDEVVSKLDSLESLIQSIEQEISLRRKQYEFYRDELLSFTPKKD